MFLTLRDAIYKMWIFNFASPKGRQDRYFNGSSNFEWKLDFYPKWGEVGIDIVIILVFFPLEEIDHQIGQWGGQYLPRSFQEILRKSHLNHFARWPQAIKSQHIEQG